MAFQLAASSLLSFTGLLDEGCPYRRSNSHQGILTVASSGKAQKPASPKQWRASSGASTIKSKSAELIVRHISAGCGAGISARAVDGRLIRNCKHCMLVSRKESRAARTRRFSNGSFALANGGPLDQSALGL